MGVTRYSDAVRRRFHRPPTSAGGDISGTAGSVSQGVVIDFHASLDGSDFLRDVGFRACACPHIIAACSLVAERLEGRPVQELGEPVQVETLQELEIPVEKTGKILILQDALRACLADYEARRGAGASGTG